MQKIKTLLPSCKKQNKKVHDKFTLYLIATCRFQQPVKKAQG
jgi:hypothetical protein